MSYQTLQQSMHLKEMDRAKKIIKFNLGFQLSPVNGQL